MYVCNVEIIMYVCKPDIILGNESWLHPDIKNNEIFPDNYNIFREDRLTDNHGGVFHAIKKDVVAHRDDLNTDCEIIWTQCQIQNKGLKSLFLASFYRPSMNDMHSLQELDLSSFKLGNRLNSNNVIIAGDVYAPDLKWSNPDATSHSSNSERLLDIIDEHGFTQMVKDPTRKDNILDIVLTNNVEIIINNVRVTPGISDHDMVLFEVNLTCRKKRPVKRKIYIRKRADTSRIKKELQGLADDLAETGYSDTPIHEMWVNFENNIHQIMDACTPHRMTSSRYNLPWYNRSLRRQTRAKQRLYNMAKKSGNPTHWNDFRTARKRLHKSL